METIELIVYLVITFIVGGLIIGFTVNIDGDTIYNKLKPVFFSKEEASFKKIYSEDLSSEIFKVWKECNFGANDLEVTMYIQNSTKINYSLEINRSIIFSTLIKYNLCHSIQSQSNNCGVREDVIINTSDEKIRVPSLVKISCNKQEKNLVITQLS